PCTSYTASCFCSFSPESSPAACPLQARASTKSRTYPRRCAITRARIDRFTWVTPTTSEVSNMTEFNPAYAVNALVFALLGIVIFVATFVVIDKVTPFHLWNEIVREKNVALAVLLGAMSIGLCIIIAAAVH